MKGSEKMLMNHKQVRGGERYGHWREQGVGEETRPQFGTKVIPGFRINQKSVVGVFTQSTYMS